MTTHRFSIVIALSIIAALALFTAGMATLRRPAAVSNSNDAYLRQRQGEWSAGVTAQQAYLDQRHGEQTAGHAAEIQRPSQPFRLAEQIAAAADVQQAYLNYRRGEWFAGVNPALAYLQYRRGEWTGK